MEPQTRFCTSGDGTRIAYMTLGEGPPLLHVQAWSSNFEVSWESAYDRAWQEQLAQGHLYITFDRRGSGASQRDVQDLSLEAHVADVAALAGHLGLERPDMIAATDGACVSIAYAAEHAARVAKLVLLAPFVRGRDIVSSEAIKGLQELIRGNWSLARAAIANIAYPTGPSERQRWFADFLRRSASPETAARYLEFHATVDVTAYLPRVTAPTLILHGRGDRNVPIRAGRDVAALLPDARFIALDGISSGTLDPGGSGYAAVAEFLDEGQGRASSPAPEPGSGTAIILFADIVDSTALAGQLGNTEFRERSRRLEMLVRQSIEANAGATVEGRTLGDGVLATFGSASDAIAAARECSTAGANVGLQLHLGLHAGDVIHEDGNVYGQAVSIAARISDQSAPNEVLVSQTVRDLARASSDVSFEDRGERELKGVGEPVRVFAVREAV